MDLNYFPRLISVEQGKFKILDRFNLSHIWVALFLHPCGTMVMGSIYSGPVNAMPWVFLAFCETYK